MMKLGVVLTKDGKAKEALDHFFKLEKKEPDNLDVKFHMAHCFIDINQMYRAEKALRNILEIDPDNVKAREILKSLI